MNDPIVIYRYAVSSTILKVIDVIRSIKTFDQYCHYLFFITNNNLLVSKSSEFEIDAMNDALVKKKLEFTKCEQQKHKFYTNWYKFFENSKNIKLGRY